MVSLIPVIGQFISTVGFPIFIAVVLLWRTDERHKDNIAMNNKLVAALTDLKVTILYNHLAEHCPYVKEKLASEAAK